VSLVQVPEWSPPQRAQKLGQRFSPMRLFQKSFKRRFSRCQFSSTIFRMIVLR